MNPFRRRPASSVLVVVDGDLVGQAPTGRPQTDSAKTRGEERPLASGWMLRFGAFRLQPGSHLVQAYAVIDDERIMKLAGSRTIDVLQ